MSGLFVVFEGGDGAGKSTQASLLCARLRLAGVDNLHTRQPGGTAIGDALRELVLDKSNDVDAHAEALIYAADKAQHVREVIRPALSAGQVVVSDRYVDSMIAYQGAGRSLDIDEVSKVAWWAVGGLRPDLTILLDVEPAEGVAGKVGKDRLESAGLDFHRRVRQHFLDLAATRPDNYLVLDGRWPIAQIADAVENAVAELLGKADRA